MSDPSNVAHNHNDHGGGGAGGDGGNGGNGGDNQHPMLQAPGADTLRLLATGILAVLPQLDTWLLLAVGGNARRSSNDPARVIPEHFGWILTEARNIDEAPGNREADFKIENGDQFSLFILGRERLQLVLEGAAQLLAHGGHTQVLADADPDVIRLSDVCAEARVARVNGDVPPGPSVRTQIQLPMVQLQQQQRTTLEFSFVPKCGCESGPHEPRRVSHIGKFEFPTDGLPFEFRSHSFDNVPLPPIRFREHTGRGVVVAVGNTPIGDSQRWIRPSAHHHVHEGADPHFELYYDLVTLPAGHPKRIPYGRTPAEENTGLPAVPGVGNCDHLLAEWDDGGPITNR